MTNKELAYKIYDKVMELENGEGGCSLYDYCIDTDHPGGFDDSRVDGLLAPIIKILEENR
jgi:hypothetical protein